MQRRYCDSDSVTVLEKHSIWDTTEEQLAISKEESKKIKLRAEDLEFNLNFIIFNCE